MLPVRTTACASAFVLLAVCGCGSGGRVPASWVGTTHPSTRWVYKSGWQTCAVAVPHSIPFVAPFSNSIRTFGVTDQCVTLYEDALGDFGGGSWKPVVGIDLQSGERRPPLSANTEAMDVSLDEQTGVCALGGGYELQCVTGPRFAVDLRHTAATAGQWVRIIECPHSGFVRQALLESDQRLLVSFAVSRPLTWDADWYLLCVDLERIPETGESK